MRRHWLLSTVAAGLLASSSSLLADEAADLFAKLDKNSDGAITTDEVSAEQKPLFERMLRTSDKNTDGKLSGEEFAAGLKGPKPSREPVGGAPRPAAGGGLSGLIPSPKAMFERMDQNKDGKLTKDELPDRLAENFDRIDANSDGSVDLAEAEKMMGALGGALAAGGGGPGAAGMIFDRLDKNSDGKLSKEEIPEDRRELFEKMAARIDPQGDGSVTKEQFIAGMKMISDAAGAGGKPAEGTPPGSPAPGAGNPADMMLKRLQAADTNGDGKLSREEAPERLRNSFDLVDANGDDLIDEKEVKALLERLRPSPK